MLNTTSSWTLTALLIAPAVLVHVAEDVCLLFVGCTKMHVLRAHWHKGRWRARRRWRRRIRYDSEEGGDDAAASLGGTSDCKSAAIVLVANAIQVEVAERFRPLLIRQT
jgi:hypothetical protein